MIGSLLIANRGEIAVRIIRTCREMNIRTVAVFSEADRDSLHVKMADDAVCVGPPPPALSYLNARNLISAAVLTHCDAVHPGVGFLAENATFAEEVASAGLLFVGAKPDVIRKLGDKVEAKRIATASKIPTIPGSSEAVKTLAEAERIAKKIGFPVIIKASAGGGGKGMRVVSHPKELPSVLAVASREAEASFSDGTLYIEKYLNSPRHVELQILSDGKGEVLVLGDRDCSLQKHHQKLLEETPSSVVSPSLRKSMSSDAVRLFHTLRYTGAGTIEFLVTGGKYYFMEVNARIQVEHPVTEMVTGIDLIRQQILANTEGELEVSQKDIFPRGYALECRINALSPGIVERFAPPGGAMVRTDTFLYSGIKIQPFYDAMIAKIIVHAPDRTQGIRRMLRALNETVLVGIKTNISEQMAILRSPLFCNDRFGTDVYGKIIKE